MAYLAGIDEAGYGPNLGPMVQAAVVWRVPDFNVDLWELLSEVLTKVPGKEDRIPVADSKALYGATGSLASLERGLFALLPMLHSAPFALDSFLEDAKAVGLAELRAEPWYNPAMLIPVKTSAEQLAADVKRWQELVPDPAQGQRAQTEWSFVCVTPTPLFNEVAEKGNSKGAVTARGVIELLRLLRSESFGYGSDNLVAVDKLGGRNYYGSILSTAFPDTWIQTVREGPDEGVYRARFVDPFDIEEAEATNLEIRIQPRAEERYLPVALASMLAKYLREILMLQFNVYWLKKVPDLKPTAGYPNDAKRFLEAIRPAMEAEGISVESVWRAK